jgi:hypothetical protein
MLNGAMENTIAVPRCNLKNETQNYPMIQLFSKELKTDLEEIFVHLCS